MTTETVMVEATQDDVDRLCGIAGELEHLPAEVRRFFDQDGRDARYLRILGGRIITALQHQGEGRVERLERELVESDEALRACEEAHGAQVPGGSR